MNRCFPACCIQACDLSVCWKFQAALLDTGALLNTRPDFSPNRPTGVPRSQANANSQDPTVGLCLGTYGSPRGVAFSYERGTLYRAPRQAQIGSNDSNRIKFGRLTFTGVSKPKSGLERSSGSAACFQVPPKPTAPARGRIY